MQTKITIPQPCNANWQDMSPVESGRHCNTCNKTVIDFSTWTPTEITTYLQSHQQEKTCGRFHQQQLQPQAIPPSPLTVRSNKYFMKAAAVLAVCSVFQLQSCTMGATVVTTDPQQPRPADTVSDPVMLLGEIVPVPTTDTSITTLQ